MINKINLYIIIFILFLSYIIINLSFNHYNVIDFLDHDEGFLLEQLALKTGLFNIHQTVSTVAEYGADFYYFKYFFLLLNHIIELNIMDVFRIKTFINTCFAAFSYLVIFRIFDLLKFKKIFYFFFLLTILSIPEIFRLSVSLKQDVNLLFFLLTLTYFFFLKSSVYGRQSDAYLFLFFLAFSLSIKAWAFPFLILLFFNNHDYTKTSLKFYKIINIMIFILFICLLNLYLIEIKNFVLTNEDFLSFYDLYSNISILKNCVLIFDRYFIYLILFLNVILFVSIKIISKNIPFKKNIFKFLIFLMIWFIIWYPYIFDLSTFTKTIIEDSYSTVLNTNSTSNKEYENIIAYIFYDLKNLKLNFIIFITFIFVPVLIYFYKSHLLNNLKILIPLFSICFFCICFVNLITDYNNQYPAKYLYFIYLNIFVFYLVNLFSKIKLFYNTFLIIFTISSILTIYINYENYLKFKNFLMINDKIIFLTDFHQKKLNLNNTKLYVCATYYPVDIKKTKINIINKSIGECMDNNFVSSLNNDDIIFFEKSSFRSESFKKKYTLYYEDYHYIVDRFGNLVNAPNQFYKKFKTTN